MPFHHSHFSSLFENATEGFVITNSAGDIVLANPAAGRMFGYTTDEMTGQKIELLIPDSYRKQHVKLRTDFYSDPQNRVMGHGRDLQGRHKEGNDFPVEVSLSTYEQAGERFAIAFIVDITHRKQIEQSVLAQQRQLETLTAGMRSLNAELEAKVEERTAVLKEALHRLEQSQRELSDALDKERQLNEIKSRFVSMASHEFRTPLSTVLSSASLLSKYTKTEEEEKRARHVEKIKASVKHLNDLLEDFLSLGRLDEGKVATAVRPFNLCEAVEETVMEMKSLAKKDQRLSHQHEGTATIESDKKLLKNILINLVSNAIKFSPEGSSIVITSNLTGDTAQLQVKDEGIGIAAEDRAHLFSSFFRGKNALNIQGTGLGLHIVKRYVELAGGTIALESRLGRGTTVTVSLPAKIAKHAKDHPDR